MKKLLFTFIIIGYLGGSISSVSAGETTPSQTQAPDLGATLPKISNPLDNPNLSVRIPTLKTLRNISCDKGLCTVPWIADYIDALYRYGIAIISILAIIALMIGGVLWLTSAGRSEKIADAKKWISGGLMGMLIMISSYMILNIINPALTQLSPLKLSYLGKEDLPDITEYQTLQEEQSRGETLNDNFKVAPKNILLVEVETTKGKRKVQVDETVAEATKKAFLEMKNAGFNVVEISDYRPGSKHCHKYGLALDINATYNYCVDCYGEKGAKVGDYYRPLDGPGAGKDYTGDPLSMQRKIIEIWTNNGWCWGGNWRTIKDYMHFSTPSCRKGAECGTSTPYDFTKSVRQNNEALGITYP